MTTHSQTAKFEHSPYIQQVIKIVKCPHCGMPAEIECVGRLTHESRLMAYHELTGLTVDETYTMLGKKPVKIQNQ